jgi:hypothetical protein
VDCPSCGRANASDRVECRTARRCWSTYSGRTTRRPTPSWRSEPISPFKERTAATDSGDGFTRFPGPSTAAIFRDSSASGTATRSWRSWRRRHGPGLQGPRPRARSPVALKTIRTEKGKGPRSWRFKQELVLRQDHPQERRPHLRPRRGRGGVKFFTMELVEGRASGISCARKDHPAEEAISFMKQMLGARRGPQPGGRPPRPEAPERHGRQGRALRIMDFGIARTADTATLTGSGEMMGPGLHSPEQVKGETTNASPTSTPPGSSSTSFSPATSPSRATPRSPRSSPVSR